MKELTEEIGINRQVEYVAKKFGKDCGYPLITTETKNGIKYIYFGNLPKNKVLENKNQRIMSGFCFIGRDELKAKRRNGEVVDVIYQGIGNVYNDIEEIDFKTCLKIRPLVEDLFDALRIRDMIERYGVEGVIWLPDYEYKKEINAKARNIDEEIIEKFVRKLCKKYKNFAKRLLGKGAEILKTSKMENEIQILRRKFRIDEKLESEGRTYYGIDLKNCNKELREVYQEMYSGLVAQYIFPNDEKTNIVVENPAEIPAVEDALSFCKNVGYASTISAFSLQNRGTWRMYSAEMKGKLSLVNMEFNEKNLENTNGKSLKKCSIIPLLQRFCIYGYLKEEKIEEIIETCRRSQKICKECKDMLLKCVKEAESKFIGE